MSTPTNEIAIQVDLAKCTRCGFCSEVCPSGIIRVDENGPVLIAPKACIKCGHCEERCPFKVKQMARMEEINNYFAERSF